MWYSRRGRIGLGARARREEAAVSWNVLWSWLVIAVLTGAGRASARESPVELGQKLARTRAALTAVRGQLNPAQWSRLSGKLVEAEKTLAEYEALVPSTGRAAAVTEGASAMADREYHKEIFRQVSLAVATCNGVEQCRIALTKELRRLAVLCATPGTQLNRWVTRAIP